MSLSPVWAPLSHPFCRTVTTCIIFEDIKYNIFPIMAASKKKVSLNDYELSTTLGTGIQHIHHQIDSII